MNRIKIRYFLLIASVPVLALICFACSDTAGAPIPMDEIPTAEISTSECIPADAAPTEAVYILSGKLAALDNYEVSVSGNVVADMWFIHQTQSLSNLIVKHGGETYLRSVSDAVIRSEHEVFMTENAAVYRKSLDDDFTVTSRETYLAEYGVCPTENIFGFIFNDQTILSAERTALAPDGSATFTYTLDPILSTALVARQTRGFGGFSGYPVYRKVKFTIHVDGAFMPVSVEGVCVYTVVIVDDVTCTQTVTYNFQKTGDDVTIPGGDDLRSLADTYSCEQHNTQTGE